MNDPIRLSVASISVANSELSRVLEDDRAAVSGCGKQIAAARKHNAAMLRWIPSIVVAVGLSFASPVFCVDPNRLISQYADTAWRVQDGFEVGTTIAQTPDGYLRFGTSTDLVRFDGVRFTPYELPLIDPPVRGFNYLLAGRRSPVLSSFAKPISNRPAARAKGLDTVAVWGVPA